MPFGIPLYALWLGAAILFGVLEAVLLGLNSIWFTLGALAAMAAALLGAGLGIQVLLFLVVSLAALVLAKRFLKERFNPRRQHTNADRILGSRALVTETFLVQALEAGLTLPILNPNQKAMMDAVAAFRVLSGEDEGCRAYVARFAGESAPAASAAPPGRDLLSPPGALRRPGA